MTRTLLERYQAAAALAPERLPSLMKNRTVVPNWIGDSEAFWYRRELEAAGHEFVRVDPTTGAKTPLFDHAELAVHLGAFFGVEVTPSALPITQYEAVDGGVARIALTDGRTVDLTHDGVVSPVNRRADVVASQDGKLELFGRDHDLWLRDTVTGDERALTTDGEPYNAWGALVDNSMVHIPLQKLATTLPPVFTGFSPSGRWVVTARVDERAAGQWPFVEHLPAHGARPQLHPIRGVLEDEEAIGQPQLAFIDLSSAERVIIELTPDLVWSFVAHGAQALTWSRDERSAYLFAAPTGSPTASLIEIDVATGTRRVCVTETDEPIYEANTYLYSLPLIHVLPDSHEAVWFSQRDGWGHLYLYDLTTGECKNHITQGNLVVSDLMRVDPARREVLFLAGCGDGGDNPYWRKLYRASLDGGSQTLLTPEPLHHELAAPAPQFFSIIFANGQPPVQPISPNGRYFVDHMSTVSQAPEIVLRDTTDGRIITVLERTDITELLAAGFQTPEQFCVKADDGTTDLWGVLTMPPDLTTGETAPVIDLMYAGYQVAWQPRGFLGTDLTSKSAAPASAYAALGFATVVVDGRGTSGRDKVFRQWTQGRPDTPRGLEDHVTAITALKANYPALDLDRVGVTGHSYGGYNSARSILLFPDFFQVAVSSAGVHVPEKMPKGSWAWHVGADAARDSETYQALGNLHLVDRLTGKLLLMFGDLDENATPDHSLALIDALIKAGKRFDMKLWPGINHYQDTRYRAMATWDYFVEHLLGQTPPAGFVPANDAGKGMEG